MRGKKGAEKRRVHTAESMLKALKLHRNGASLRKAAVTCNVKFTTLRRYALKHAHVKSEDLKYQRLTPNYGINKIFVKEQEELLMKFLKEYEERFDGVSTKDIRRAAYEVAVAYKLAIPKNWQRNKVAGAEWYRAFRGRNPGFCLKRSSDPSREFDRESVRAFYEAHSIEDPIKLFKQEIVEVDPELRETEGEESQVSVWSYFERESNGRTRCAVCRTVVTRKQMQNHLKEHHPKLVFEEEASEEEASDTEEDVYTEVVYLEEEQNPRTPKREKKHRDTRPSTPRPQPIQSNQKPRRRVSSSDEEPLQMKRARRDGDDDIEQFARYVACLLKKLPWDACMELQLEIVNLIMRKQLELKRKPANATEKNGEASVDMDSSGMQSVREHCKTDCD